MGRRVRDDPYGLRATIDALRETAAANGGKMSLADVAYEARKHGAPPGFDHGWLGAVLSGKRPYDTQLLAALAKAVGHQPDELAHYRLAEARDLLDEHIVGLDDALARLDQITRALTRRAAQPPATEAARQAARRRKTQATRDEPPTAQEDG